MNQTRYKIIFSGELMPDASLDTVKENLARLFKSDVTKINALFGGKSITLKRNLAQAEANQYLTALQGAGAMVHKELDLTESLSLVKTEDHDVAPSTAESMICPKCQHVQTKANTCSACGIIIDKYLTRQVAVSESGSSATLTAAPTASPYAPPKASVGDNLPEFGALKPFTTNGRIGRLRYLAWTMVMLLAAIPIMVIAAGGLAISPIFGSLLIVVAVIAVIVVGTQICAQRLHDIGWSAWLLLLNIVPVIGSVFSLLMLVMPGTHGANRYGPMPPPNSIAVKVLAGLFLFAIIGGTIVGTITGAVSALVPTLFSGHAS